MDEILHWVCWGFDGGDLSLGLENMWAEREMRSEENGEE